MLFVTIHEQADQILPWLRYQSELKGMNLYGGGCTSQSCATLADACPKLEKLYIHSANLSVNDCRHLARLTELRDFTISGSVEAGGFAELRALPDVTRFGYFPARTPPSKEMLHELAGMPFVERLYLHLTDAELETLLTPSSDDPPVLPHVWRLQFGTATFTEQTLAKLKALPNLTHLTLSETKVNDAGATQLASLPKLRQLYLAHCPITDEGCKSLAKLTNLESLHLGATDITIEGVRHLTELKHLRQLTIKQCYQIRGPSEINSLPKSFLSRCRVVY